MHRLIWTVLFLFSASSFAQTLSMRALRIDPSELYDIGLDETSMTTMAAQVMNDVQAWGFNTVYVYAYNSYYGAMYPTSYTSTIVEGDFGQRNVFGALVSAAHARGVKVIAVLPVNDFRHVWMAQPSWRVKTRAGADYAPSSIYHFLSVSHADFQAWYKGFIADFLAKNPAVDGLEAVEPGYDLFWKKDVDYNPAIVNKFKVKYPGISLTSGMYYRFRAQQLTAHLGLFCRLAHASGKEAHVVQTWTALSTGALMTSSAIRDGLGFDFDGLLQLASTSRPDVIMAEFMWQQWKANYGTGVFTPSWVNSAANSFVTFVNGRSRPVIHMELSEMSGKYGSYSATKDEVLSSASTLPTGAAGFDVYDYKLWKTRALLGY